MKIYCPKCHTCYSVKESLIPEGGKKLRCKRCGEIWLCMPDDSLQEVPVKQDLRVETDSSDADEAAIQPTDDSLPQNISPKGEDDVAVTPADQPQEDNKILSDDEMNKIFSRLNDETSKITTEKDKLPFFKRFFPKTKKLLGWNNRLTVILEILVILLIIALSIFGMRYNLVRKFPQLETVFGQMGIPSRVIGEGLTFENITRNYMEDDEKQLNIKGFIVNTTSKALDIPTIAINFLDNDANTLAQIQKKAEVSSIEGGNKTPFNFIVDVPPEQAKFVVLTFIQ